MRRVLLVLSLFTVLGGAFLVGEQLWLGAKASLARVLIARAFDAHLEDGGIHPPWSWADTHPIARLEAPRLGIHRTVLSGASGSSMAFGPGHVDGTALPNRSGNCALAGHRDSWFAFLEELHLGDELILESLTERGRYVITALRVHPDWDTGVLERGDVDRLTLITCYPFDGWTRSTRRYIVTAKRMPTVSSEGRSASERTRTSEVLPTEVPSPGAGRTFAAAGARRATSRPGP